MNLTKHDCIRIDFIFSNLSPTTYAYRVNEIITWLIEQDIAFETSFGYWTDDVPCAAFFENEQDVMLTKLRWGL